MVEDGKLFGMPDTYVGGYFIEEAGVVYLTDARGRPYKGAYRKPYRGESAEAVARELWRGRHGGGCDYRGDAPIRYGDPRWVARA
jgi:hypothetical protein